MDAFQDLVPRNDPKGGSPRTPSAPIPLKAYQNYVSNGNGNGTVWKVATSLLAGLFISMTVAYFTALRGQGVSRAEMQEYVDKYSPYNHDKELITLQQANQDEKIGVLTGHKDRMYDLIKMLQEKHIGYERDLQDHDQKIKLLTNYIEAEKTPKR